MALVADGPSLDNNMDTSNFAHVIFQNVGKSYLPHAALECHYTLTQFIKPHPKDWVGIFKVGWSTARDYYTFLWSPLPENYVDGTAINRTVVFQGYYVPNDDGEFYQFCYVTHKGEIRGASTPFLFRANSPSEEELLTVEDDCNSDILVVTTKAGLLEQKVEEAHRVKDELVKKVALLQQEMAQLESAKESLQSACKEEEENCAQLKRQNQELQSSSRVLQEEKEEVKSRLEEATSRVLQLEADLIGVNQRGLLKETELDFLKDRMKKLIIEKGTLESQVNNEKDEKELYKVHLKNRELDNTRLNAELQMMKSVDVNQENTIAQFKEDVGRLQQRLTEEVGRLQQCLTEKEEQYKEVLAKVSPLGDLNALKEQLRQKEEQLQANQQQLTMLGAELRDASSARDRTMSELYHMKLEVDVLRQAKADAEDHCSRLENLVEQMKAEAKQEATKAEEAFTDPAIVPELQREVEDLKLRLHMAAEHYKEKYKECTRLQKQVLKLAEQQGEVKRNSTQDLTAIPASVSPDTSVPDPMLETIIQESKYRRYKQLLMEEKERSGIMHDELAKMASKMKEQLKISENLKLQLSSEEDRCMELKKSNKKPEQVVGGKSATENFRLPPFNPQYHMPYVQDTPNPLLVSQSPPKLQFGNPYASVSQSKDEDDDEVSDEQLLCLPPMGPPSWDSNVVCIQPARIQARPDGRDESDVKLINTTNNNVNTNEKPVTAEPPNPFVNDGQTPFCFDPSMDMKRCPLCEVIFPPNYDQSKFEEHVESHWKICPMCSEQFPLDCDQKVYENHVLTHFDGNPIEFD
ncbi:tax1-binding protein 1 homolog B isoform X2 [Stigmatopora argus]